MNGIFTISLDFELHWGGFDKWPIDRYVNYFLQTRQVIPQMLDLFATYDVHVTWATVGMLMSPTRDALLANAPPQRPTYTRKELSAYHYISNVGIGIDENEDPYHFASSLVSRILNTPYQELGSHTFSHFYCNEDGQTLAQFRDDIKAAARAASAFGCPLHSLVFPRNQFNDSYLKVCCQEGIRAVRSNPQDWFWKIHSTEREPAFKRLVRGMDAYLPVGVKKTYPLSSIPLLPGLPVCLPASRLLRPYDRRGMGLNQLKLRRIRSEMEHAARSGEVYHLWWHPHNFGMHPAESLRGLERILKHFSFCSHEFGMRSLNMNETVELLMNEA